MPNCWICRQSKSEESFHLNAKRNTGFQAQCKDCDKKRDRSSSNKKRSNYRRKLRLEFIERRGGKCETCGFTDIRALQIDHVKGGGKKEILEALRGTTGLGKYYKEVLADTTGKYQVLCANCNWIKSILFAHLSGDVGI